MQLNTNQMMNVKDRHFTLNRILLLAVGLWPYTNSIFVRFQLICYFSIVISFIVFQVFSVTFCIIGLTIMYNSFCANGKTIKILMEELQHVCSDLRGHEINIIEEYSDYGKRYTIIFTMIFVCSGSIILCIQLWPEFLDIILSLNESRTRRLPVMTEYFIDQKRYFYFLLLHVITALCIAMVSYIALWTMLVAYLKYACGMFKIASYRIERTMKLYVLQDINLQKEKLICNGIICAIDIHRKAMQFAECLISSFEISFMLLIVFGVITLSLNVFRVFQIVQSTYDIMDFLVSFIIAFLCILGMFLANFIGQELTDHYNQVYMTVCQVRWYIASVHVQKVLLFILQRTTKTFGLNIAGLFTASLESFCTLVKASISYITVMYSVQ